MILQVLTLIFLTPLVTCHADEQWTHNVIYYDPQNLTCENSHISPWLLSGDISIKWILPTGEILRPGGEEHSRVDVASNGYWLNIKRTNDEDFGVYHCLIFVSGELTYNVRIGVNINGPFWGHMKERYLPHAITAAIASAITFAIAAVMCFCYDRQQNRGENAIDAYEQMMKEKLEEDQSKENKAYVEMEALPEKSPPANGVEAPPQSDSFTKF